MSTRLHFPGKAYLGLLALTGGLLVALTAGGAFAQTLGGVSCGDVTSNGLAAQFPSLPLFNNPLDGSAVQPLPPRYGFDYLNGYVWVRNAPGSQCASSLNDFFLCAQTNGRPGDSDGDGVRNEQGGGLCSFATVDVGDGDGTAATDPLSDAEAWILQVDRDCNGIYDLTFRALGPNAQLRVTADAFTGKVGQVIGGSGVAFAIAPTTNTPYTSPACDGEQGQVLFHIPNWDQYFAAPGLSAGLFTWRFDGGNIQDGPGEDQIVGNINLAAPLLAIDKSPDLTLCEQVAGQLSIKITNKGNTKVENLSLTDLLPNGWAFEAIVSPAGVTANQVGNLVTFSLGASNALDPCQELTILFTVKPVAECQAGPNLATVEGQFRAYCIQGGNAVIESQLVGPYSDSSQLVCLQPPAVTVLCEVPAEVCVGQNYTVKGTATNTSLALEDITITLKTAGGAAIKTQKFVGVPAGESRVLESDPIACAVAGVNNYTVEAKAENTCGSVDAQPSNCSVTCKELPCVNQAQCTITPSNPDFGGSYTVSGSACNCGDRPADLTITIKTGAGTVVKTQVFVAVPAGECRTLTSDPFTCEGLAEYTIEAKAANDCGETQIISSSCSVTCEQPTCCWLTMGGFLNAGIRSGNKDNTFGGNVGPPPSGSWQHIQRNGRDEVFNFHSHDAHVLACGNDGTAGPCHPEGDSNWINFGGTGKYSLNGGARTGEATWTARAEDHGEPGRQGWQNGGCGTPDFYRIEVRDKDTGEVVFTAEGIIDGGNIQIHDCKHAKETSSGRTSGNGRLKTAGADDTSAETASVGTSLELYRPTPNPFTNSTTIAYAVGGNGQDVQIGIYNVAGRLVRTLASGFQAAGRYEVSWNGRSDDGATATHGVYFIRALVGGTRVNEASRILYLR